MSAVTVLFECREVGSGLVTVATQHTEGVLSERAKASLLEGVAPMLAKLQGQHNGSKSVLMTVCEDGEPTQSALGILTDAEVLAMESDLLNVMSGRLKEYVGPK